MRCGELSSTVVRIRGVRVATNRVAGCRFCDERRAARPLRLPAPRPAPARPISCGAGGGAPGPRSPPVSTGPHSRCAQRCLARAAARAAAAPPAARPFPRTRSCISSRKPSTEEMSAKRYQRSLWMRSSPAVCGPRSISRPEQHGGLLRHHQRALEVVLPAGRRGCRARSNASERRFRPSSASCTCASLRFMIGLAAALLVAARHQRVQRHRIAVRHGAGLFHQRAQHAGFDQGVRGAHGACGRDNRGRHEEHRDSDLRRRLQHGGHRARAPSASTGASSTAREVAAVISNRADAGGLALAREQGIADRSGGPQAPSPAARPSTPRWPPRSTATSRALVVLAGFMRILTPGFVARYAGPAAQHPSVAAAGLSRPAHAPARAGGRLPVRRRHRAPGDGRAGPRADPGAGGGAGAARTTPPTPLAARVLTQEHLIYPRAIAELLPTL